MDDEREKNFLADCSPEFFEKMMDHTFVVTSCSDESQSAELQLIEMTQYPDRVALEGLRIPFSLIFKPAENQSLPSRCETYRFQHPENGSFEAFATPISMPTIEHGPVHVLEVVFS